MKKQFSSGDDSAPMVISIGLAFVLIIVLGWTVRLFWSEPVFTACDLDRICRYCNVHHRIPWSDEEGQTLEEELVRQRWLKENDSPDWADCANEIYHCE